jgi:hypothetical protein
MKQANRLAKSAAKPLINRTKAKPLVCLVLSVLPAQRLVSVFALPAPQALSPTLLLLKTAPYVLSENLKLLKAKVDATGALWVNTRRCRVRPIVAIVTPVLLATRQALWIASPASLALSPIASVRPIAPLVPRVASPQLSLWRLVRAVPQANS